MKVVALISGGKDSCYNMMQCVAEGHELTALANLYPKQQDELDSYMYQTVGHHVIELYAEAVGLPLYRQAIEGGSVEQGRDYRPTEGDEVEDLYQLLLTVKKEMGIEAVSVGAILSNYQRVRVENVCSRLGLTPLAFLWRRGQEELLQEMIDAQVHAIIIKVAALGLTSKQLGLSLAEIQPHMLKMRDKYQLNVCGEGGEFESLTLDCPLFNKRIVIDSSEVVTHSEDAFASVYYLHFKSMHLEDKDIDASVPFCQRIANLKMKRGSGLLQELGCEATAMGNEDVLPHRTINPDEPSQPQCNFNLHGYLCISGITAVLEDSKSTSAIQDATKGAMDILQDKLEHNGHSLSDVGLVHLYVGNMSHFAAINSVYCKYFTLNPPARVCVQINLPSNIAVQIDCLSHHSEDPRSEGSLLRHTMHVQSISHWAPANIGPYSQSVQIGNNFFCAGMIGLCPSSMQMIEGGIDNQCRLSLRGVSRVLEAMHHGLGFSDVIINVCYVSHPKYIPIAREHWDQALSKQGDDDQSSYGTETKVRGMLCTVVVPMLPKGALVEWHVVASKDKPIWKRKVKTRISKHNYTIDLQVLSSDEDGCGAAMAIIDWSSAGEYDQLLASIATHVVECIGDELKDTRLTLQDALSLRIFYQQGDKLNQSDVLKAFQSSFETKSIPCPAITPVAVESLSGQSVMSMLLWIQS